MLINKLAQLETKVLNMKGFSKKDIDGLTINSFVHPKKVKLHYYPEKATKTKIVLHYTVGNLLGDFTTLTSPNKVSTAYLIGKSGQVLELFNPDYWSYHLGKNALGGNEYMSKQSIGIEISNYGWLEKRGNKLYTAYGDFYCTLDEKEHYTYMNIPFRPEVWPSKFLEGQYWANFTEEQYTSVKTLLQILTKQYNIPYTFLPPEKRLQYTSDVIHHRGICTHVNFRKDKWDIGPNFDWSKIT